MKNLFVKSVFLLLICSDVLANVKPVIVSEFAPTTTKPYIEVPGTLMQEKNLSINATVNGELIKMPAIGEKIYAGQPIAIMEDLELELMVEQQQMQIKQLELSSSHLQKRYTALKKLQRSNHESEMVLNQLFTDIKISQVQLNVLARQLEIYLRKKEKLILHSPVNGIVIERMRLPGEYVESFTKLMTIQASDKNQVRIRLGAKYARHIELGSTVVISVDNKLVDGVIESIHPINQGFSLIYEARITTSAKQIFLGSLANVRIPFVFNTPHQVVPNDAIVYFDGKPHIVVMDKMHKAKRILVNIFERFKQFVIIQKISELDSKIVVKGNETIQNDDQLKVIEQRTYTL